MATIVATLNAVDPGAQADNETTDINLTYKVYNNTDSYATAESFGSHVTDSDVTVSAGVVTITNVVEPSGVYAYKISSVDEAGNESTLSPEFVTFTLEDTFDGTTIDTAKWGVTNPNSSDIVISQNNELIIASAASSTISSSANYVKSVDDFDFSSDVYAMFDIQSSNQVDSAASFNVGFHDPADATNRIRFMTGTGGAGTINYDITISGTGVDSGSFSLDVSTYKTIKISDNGTQIKVDYWNGSSWTNITTYTGTLPNSTTPFKIAVGGQSGSTNTVKLDNVYIGESDFSAPI